MKPSKKEWAVLIKRFEELEKAANKRPPTPTSAAQITALVARFCILAAREMNR